MQIKVNAKSENSVDGREKEDVFLLIKSINFNHCLDVDLHLSLQNDVYSCNKCLKDDEPRNEWIKIMYIKCSPSPFFTIINRFYRVHRYHQQITLNQEKDTLFNDDDGKKKADDDDGHETFIQFKSLWKSCNYSLMLCSF